MIPPPQWDYLNSHSLSASASDWLIPQKRHPEFQVCCLRFFSAHPASNRASLQHTQPQRRPRSDLDLDMKILRYRSSDAFVTLANIARMTVCLPFMYPAVVRRHRPSIVPFSHIFSLWSSLACTWTPDPRGPDRELPPTSTLQLPILDFEVNKRICTCIFMRTLVDINIR